MALASITDWVKLDLPAAFNSQIALIVHNIFRQIAIVDGPSALLRRTHTSRSLRPFHRAPLRACCSSSISAQTVKLRVISKYLLFKLKNSSSSTHRFVLNIMTNLHWQRPWTLHTLRHQALPGSFLSDKRCDHL